MMLNAEVNSLKHTPVSYDIWVSSTGLLITLSPQVKLADHSVQLYLHTHVRNNHFYKILGEIAVISCQQGHGLCFLKHNEQMSN